MATVLGFKSLQHAVHFPALMTLRWRHGHSARLHLLTAWCTPPCCHDVTIWCHRHSAGFICLQDDVHLPVVMTSRYDVMDTVLASAYNSLLEFQLLKNSAYMQHIHLEAPLLVVGLTFSWDCSWKGCTPEMHKCWQLKGYSWLPSLSLLPISPLSLSVLQCPH